MTLIKTLSEAEKAERTRFKIPRSVQDSIPVSEIYGDGAWHVGRKYSRTWRFSDINYVSAADEDRKRVIRTYGGILSSLPAGATVKLTIVNHRLNEKEFQRTMLMPGRGDGSDRFRGELNGILTAKAADSKNLVQDKYITMSVPAKTAADMEDEYRLTHYQRESMEVLLLELDKWDLFAIDLDISDATALSVWENLPDDLSPERRLVVQYALSLCGKVTYFWGGKSLVLGPDPRWGQSTQVWAAGSPTTGKEDHDRGRAKHRQRRRAALASCRPRIVCGDYAATMTFSAAPDPSALTDIKAILCGAKNTFVKTL